MDGFVELISFELISDFGVSTFEFPISDFGATSFTKVTFGFELEIGTSELTSTFAVETS